MKIYTNSKDPRFTKYCATGAGRTPIVIHHVTGKITLVSPGNHKERVDIITPDQNLFIFATFQKLLVEWDSLDKFLDRVDDLFIKYSQAERVSVYNRRVRGIQFHCATNLNVEFIVDALKLIEAKRTLS
jgi:hypothetical protein